MDTTALFVFLSSFVIPADSNELGFSMGGCHIDSGGYYEDHLCENGFIFKPYFKRNFIDQGRKGWSVFLVVDHESHPEKGDFTFNENNQTPQKNYMGLGASYKFKFL